MRFLVPNLPDTEIEALQEAVPEVEILVARTREEAVALVPEADALYGNIRPEVIRAGRRLRWVQSGSAGVEGILFPELVESSLVLTNARGLYAPEMADHTLAFMLSLARSLPMLYRRQREEKWVPPRSVPSFELSGQMLLIIGFGSTGQEIAKRAAGFGMRILATRRHPGAPPAGVESIHPPEALRQLLPEADHVALCVALTAETRHLFGAAEFRLMKPTAYLVNVARGAIIDTDALVAALQNNEIAGAGLDVTDPEPLPAGHPLWQMENVILTPHSSGQSQYASRRLLDLVRENLRRFAAGEPLLNVVDKQAGY